MARPGQSTNAGDFQMFQIRPQEDGVGLEIVVVFTPGNMTDGEFTPTEPTKQEVITPSRVTKLTGNQWNSFRTAIGTIIAGIIATDVEAPGALTRTGRIWHE